jgi:hypothetical protein
MTESILKPQKAEIVSEGELKIGEYTESFLLERAKKLVSERTGNWDITSVAAEERIPKFNNSGKLLAHVERLIHLRFF